MAIARKFALGGLGKEFATSVALKTLELAFIGVPSVAMVLMGGAIGALHGESSNVRLFPLKKVFSSADPTN